MDCSSHSSTHSRGRSRVRSSFARATLTGSLAISVLLGACSSEAPKPSAPEQVTSAAVAEALKGAELEKTELKLGFIKLTDCAPLVIAKEKGFFKDEGLNVEIEAQANWKILLDRVISGEIDGAHMLAGQPIAATIGFGTEADVVTAFSMDLNGNAVTVSNAIWAEMQKHDPKLASPTPPHPISAESLVPVVKRLKAKGDPLKLGMVFPARSSRS